VQWASTRTRDRTARCSSCATDPRRQATWFSKHCRGGTTESRFLVGTRSRLDQGCLDALKAEGGTDNATVGDGVRLGLVIGAAQPGSRRTGRGVAPTAGAGWQSSP
jgi:hypothetical protein